MADDDIAVVDDANRFVRWTDRREVHGGHLPHRSIHVLVFDGRGRMLVQQRAHDKLTWPGHWDIAAAGHVERSDYPGSPDDDLDAVYAAVAARELHEELAIDAPLELLVRQGPTPGVHYEHLHLFEARWDGAVTLQECEVAAWRWLGPHGWDAGDATPRTHALTAWVRWLRSRGRFLGR